jgi:hypothetical protein
MNSEKTNDDNLINLLLEETYQSISSDEDEKSRDELLNHYNHNQLNVPELSFENFIEGKISQLYEFTYKFETSCFQIQAEGMVLDFPSNWSYFSKAKHALDLDVVSLCEIITDSEDVFYEVLNVSFFKSRPALLAHSKGRVYFVCFDKKSDLAECLDLYCLHTDKSEDKKAA